MLLQIKNYHKRDQVYFVVERWRSKNLRSVIRRARSSLFRFHTLNEKNVKNVWRPLVSPAYNLTEYGTGDNIAQIRVGGDHAQ
jgi:hypothetical protein